MSGYLDAENIEFAEDLLVVTGKTIEDCISPLKEGKFLGKGMFGSVVEACENGDICDKYVAKIQKGNWEPYVMLKIQILTNKGIIPQIMPELFRSCESGIYEIIIMERMEGSILSKGSITKNQLIDIINYVNILHDNKFIHRDLKFNNFLYKKRRVYLADFGLAVMTPTKRQIMEDWALLAVSLILNDIPLPDILLNELRKFSEADVLIEISVLVRQAIRIRRKKGLPVFLFGLTDKYLTSQLNKGFGGLKYNSKEKTWGEIESKISIKVPGARGI